MITFHVCWRRAIVVGQALCLLLPAEHSVAQNTLPDEDETIKYIHRKVKLRSEWAGFERPDGYHCISDNTLLNIPSWTERGIAVSDTLSRVYLVNPRLLDPSSIEADEHNRITIKCAVADCIEHCFESGNYSKHKERYLWRLTSPVNEITITTLSEDLDSTAKALRHLLIITGAQTPPDPFKQSR